MFCPTCKAEYLPGVTRCSDCDVALVKHLPNPDNDSDVRLPDTSLRRVWSGEDQNACASICKQLREADIPFNVIQHKRQFLKGVEEKYIIGVRPEFIDSVKLITDSYQVDFTDEVDDQSIMEVPAQDGIMEELKQDSDRDLAKWDPRNADVEVWSRHLPEYTSMIESSLRENHIHYRADVSDDSSVKIYVIREDECRAREIVREIKNGAPPF